MAPDVWTQPDDFTLSLWSAPCYRFTLLRGYEPANSPDQYLKSRGIPVPLNWGELYAYLRRGEVQEFTREELFQALNPELLAVDRYWRMLDIYSAIPKWAVAPPSMRISDAQVEEMRERGDHFVDLKPGVVVRGSNYVRASDGKGVRREQDGWVRLSDGEPVEAAEVSEYVTLVDPREFQRPEKARWRCRDRIGDLIEVLRQEPTLLMEAEIGGDWVVASYSREAQAAEGSAGSESEATTTSPTAEPPARAADELEPMPPPPRMGRPRIPEEELREIIHLSYHCDPKWPLAALANKFTPHHVDPEGAIAKRLYRNRAKYPAESCSRCKNGDYPSPPPPK